MYRMIENFRSVVFELTYYILNLMYACMYMFIYARDDSLTQSAFPTCTSSSDGMPVIHISSGTVCRDDFGKICDGRSNGQNLLWLLSRNHKLLIYVASSTRAADAVTVQTPSNHAWDRPVAKIRLAAAVVCVGLFYFVFFILMRIGDANRRTLLMPKEPSRDLLKFNRVTSYLVFTVAGISTKGISKNHFNR